MIRLAMYIIQYVFFFFFFLLAPLSYNDPNLAACEICNM